MNLPELSVNRRVAMLMVFFAVILVGGIVFFGLKLDLLPNIEPPVVNVLVTWPGASVSEALTWRCWPAQSSAGYADSSLIIVSLGKTRCLKSKGIQKL